MPSLLQMKRLLPLLLLLLLQGCRAAAEDEAKPNFGKAKPPKMGGVLVPPNHRGRGPEPPVDPVTVHYRRPGLRMRCDLAGQFYAWVHQIEIVGLQREINLDSHPRIAVFDTVGYQCVVCQQPSCQNFTRQRFHVIEMPRHNAIDSGITLVDWKPPMDLKCPLNTTWFTYDQTTGQMAESVRSVDGMRWLQQFDWKGYRQLRVKTEMFSWANSETSPDVFYFGCKFPNGSWHKLQSVRYRPIPYERKEVDGAPIFQYNLTANEALTDEATVPEEVMLGSTVTLACKYSWRQGPVSWQFRHNSSEKYRSLPDGTRSGQFSVDKENLTVTSFNATTIGFYRCRFRNPDKKWTSLYRHLLLTSGIVNEANCRMDSEGWAVIPCGAATEAHSNVTWRITPTGQREPFELRNREQKDGFAAYPSGWEGLLCLSVKHGQKYHQYQVQCLVNGYSQERSMCTLTSRGIGNGSAEVRQQEQPAADATGISISVTVLAGCSLAT